MSLVKEVLSGYSARIRLNNSLELQKAKHIRPSQIKMEIAVIKTAIANELKDNAELKAQYDSITLEVPA
jgi:hypothetical protein